MNVTKPSVFVIIISTQIHRENDSKAISKIMQGFNSIFEWSHDLQDSDKILRIVSNKEISQQLVSQFTSVGIQSTVIGVFDKKTEP